MLKTPQERLRLARGVGDGLPNLSEDVSALAAALDHLGRYNVKEETPVSGRSQVDWKLDNALRGFQRSFGLKPDGRVLPGGPTAATLNTLMAGGLSALVPDPAVHRTRGDFLSRLKLKGSVGEGGDNASDDRTWVRLGLGALGRLPLGKAWNDELDEKTLADGPDFAAIEGPLRRELFERIEASGTIIPTFTRWATASDKERLQAMQELASLFIDVYGLEGQLTVQFGDTSSEGTWALFKPERSQDAIGTITIDLDRFHRPNRHGIGGVLHELGHGYEEFLVAQLLDGSLPKSDPRYRFTELLALTRPYYNDLVKGLRKKQGYYTDPSEWYGGRLDQAWGHYLDHHEVQPF